MKIELNNIEQHIKCLFFFLMPRYNYDSYYIIIIIH